MKKITIFLLLALSFTSISFAQFGEAEAITYICHQADMEIADFDGDGDFDAIMVQPTIGYSKRILVIYENLDGAGNEWAQHDFFITDDVLTAKTVVVEDFNNDGWLDFAVSGSLNTGSLLFENEGLGTIDFDKKVVAFEDGHKDMEAGDVNGDGFADIVLTFNSALVSSYNQGGTGVFTENFFIDAYVPDEFHFQDMKLADLDNDNDLDIVSLNRKKVGDFPYQYYEGYITWYENEDGLGTFSERIILETFDSFPSLNEMILDLEVVDFNGDNRLDFIFQNEGLFIKYQNPDGTFTPIEMLTDNPGTDERTRYIPIDFDMDGDMDIVRAGEFDQQMSWYRNTNGNGTFEKVDVGNKDFNSSYTLGKIVDIEGDGDLDFFMQNTQSAQHGLFIYTNDGSNESTSEGVKISDNINGPFQAKSTDMDGDGDEDLLYIGRITGNMYWSENMDGAGFLSNPILLFEDEGIRYFDLGDFDGDGDEDIVVSWKKNGPAEVYIYEKLNNTPTFAPKKVLLSNFNTNEPLAVADMDADGDLDILIEWSGSLIWLSNTGNLEFVEQPSLANGVDFIGVGDFNGDAFPDLCYFAFGGDPVLLIRSAATGGDIQVIGDNPFYDGLEIADIDADGDDDIVVRGKSATFQWEFRLLLNEGGVFSEHVLAENLNTLNWWPEFSVTDLDADGKKDILMRNVWFRQVDSPLNFVPIDIPFNEGGSDLPPILEVEMDDDGYPDLVFDNIGQSLFWRPNRIFNGYLLEGNVFLDADEDCQFAAPDTSLYGWVVKVEDDSTAYYTSTSPFGSYADFLPDSGEYVLNVLRPSAYWGSCVEDTTIFISPNSGYGNVDFPVQVEQECPLLGLQVGGANYRPCIDGFIGFNYCNYGTVPAEDAQLVVELEDWLIINSTSIPWASSTDSTYTFDLGDVGVGECGQVGFNVTPDCDVADVGDVFCVNAFITPDEICLPLDSLWDGSSIVANGYCENDSIVFQLQNIGMGDMAEARQFRVEFIVNDDIVMLMQADTFQLDIDEVKEIRLPAEAQATRIVADQDENHPLVSMASTLVANCLNPPPNSVFANLINQFPDQDGNPFSELYCRALTASYDPNDKRAFPAGIGGEYIENDWELEYNIRFQNTGNDTAFVVVIKDHISENLDLSTLRIGGSSHDFIWDLNMNRDLIFTFNNILLPDSTTNLALSQGYVQFFISPKDSLPVLTNIDNNAFIYFDSNDPIETNNVRRTIRKPVTADSEHFALCSGDFFEELLVLNDTIVVDTLVDTQEGCFLFFNHISATPTEIYEEVMLNSGDLFNGIPVFQDTVFTEMIIENDCETTIYTNVFILNNTSNPTADLYFKIAPNPARDVVNILFGHQQGNQAVYEILNINGQTLESGILKNEIINIENLTGGIYFIKVMIEDSVDVRKLVILK